MLHGHVYLIDDNLDILKQLTKVLKRYGLTVQTYIDAESFLNNFIEVAPAVVLLDMALPGINGIATFERLSKSGIKTPVIYLSGQSEPQEIIDALKLGANDFLWKPFSIEKLIAAIEKALAADDARIKSQISTRQVAYLWSLMTDREKQVCRLLALGYGNNMIAEQLDLKPDTIKKHKAKIMEKIGAASFAELLKIFEGFEFS